MTIKFLWTELINIDLEVIWLKQDDAEPHFENDKIDLMGQNFPRRIISRNSNINYPPRFCNLTQWDHFLLREKSGV